MSPLKRSNNIAARMGRWSASHWKTAVFGWLLLVVLVFMVGAKIGTKNTSDADSIVGEAHTADQILRDGFPESHPNTEIVLIQGKRLRVGDPAFQATVKDVIASVSRFDSVKNVKSPLSGHADLVSTDRHTVSSFFALPGRAHGPGSGGWTLGGSQRSEPSQPSGSSRHFPLFPTGPPRHR